MEVSKNYLNLNLRKFKGKKLQTRLFQNGYIFKNVQKNVQPLQNVCLVVKDISIKLTKFSSHPPVDKNQNNFKVFLQNLYGLKILQNDVPHDLYCHFNVFPKSTPTFPYPKKISNYTFFRLKAILLNPLGGYSWKRLSWSRLVLPETVFTSCLWYRRGGNDFYNGGFE